MDYNLDDLLPYNQSLDIYNNGYAGIKQRTVNIPEKQNYWTVPVLIKSPTKEMNDLRIGLNEVNDKLNKQNQERNNDKEEIKNDIKTNDNRSNIKNIPLFQVHNDNLIANVYLCDNIIDY